MLGIKERPSEAPDRGALEALVPPDHCYRHLAAALDLTFVRELVRDRYAAGGRPSVDPVVSVKLQLVRFFEGVRRELPLLRHAADRVSVRWYLGYGLRERLPHHSSLTKIRMRLGVEVFQRFFDHVVELCRAAGLVRGQELFVDATRVPANAAVGSLVPRFSWRWRRERRPAPGAHAVPPAEPPPESLAVALTPAQRQQLAAAHRAVVAAGGAPAGPGPAAEQRLPALRGPPGERHRPRRRADGEPPGGRRPPGLPHPLRGRRRPGPRHPRGLGHARRRDGEHGAARPRAARCVGPPA
jgi:transposase